MWERGTKDPLARLLFEEYSLNLLKPPREKTAVGDLYIKYGKKISTPGRIKYLLEPPLEMPNLILNESIPDVSGVVSYGVSFHAGFNWFEGFLSAFGIGGIIGKIRLHYEKKQAKLMKFRFSDVTRDWVDVFELGAKLEGHKVREEQPFWHSNNQLYLVTSVARTPSISIRVEREDGKTVSFGLDISNILGGTTGVSLNESTEHEIVVRGKKLVFGVQLYEMLYDRRFQKLKFIPTGIIRVGKQEKIPLKPSFIGGSKGDVFINAGTADQI